MTANPDGPQTYRIVVRGRLDKSWALWFNNVSIDCAHPDDADLTTLTGPMADQAALRGLLNKLWDLNLTLESVSRIHSAEGARQE